MSSIDWSELVKGKKGALTIDNQRCGEVIGDREDSIIIQDGQSFYKIPKSKATGYNGSELTLNLTTSDLGAYEQKKDKDGNLTSIAEYSQ